MNYGQIIEYDTANGPGFRLSLFVSGCSNHCEGCFQPETWNPKFGKEFTIETEDKIIQSLKRKPHDGRITILGGDPFELYNQEQVSKLIDRICIEVPQKNIWIYLRIFIFFLFTMCDNIFKKNLTYFFCRNNYSYSIRCLITGCRISIITLFILK